LTDSGALRIGDGFCCSCQILTWQPLWSISAFPTRIWHPRSSPRDARSRSTSAGSRRPAH